MTTRLRQPWERIEANAEGKVESPKAFQAFQLYLQLGKDRTLRAVGERLGKSEAWIETWSFTWDWVNRAALFDDEQNRVMIAAALKASERKASEWAIYREDQRDIEKSLSQRLREKADQMLNWPLSERTQEVRNPDGTVTSVTIKPIKWTLSDCVKMIDLSSKLARLAAGMETEKQLLEIVNKDLDNMSDEQLAQHYQQLEGMMAKLTSNYQSSDYKM